VGWPAGRRKPGKKRSGKNIIFRGETKLHQVEKSKQGRMNPLCNHNVKLLGGRNQNEGGMIKYNLEGGMLDVDRASRTSSCSEENGTDLEGLKQVYKRISAIFLLGGQWW